MFYNYFLYIFIAYIFTIKLFSSPLIPLSLMSALLVSNEAGNFGQFRVKLA